VIDFRYHLVSIVAVFLALAIGIVIGATALKPATLKVLDRESSHEQQQINNQRATIGSQHNQITSDQAFAKANAPLVLHNLLAGQRVVVVVAPGADGSAVSGVTAALQAAGAKVTAQASLQPAFFGTSAGTENSLEALAQSVAPPGVTPATATPQPGLGTATAGQQQAAQVLASALVTKNGADLPAAQTEPILHGFAKEGFLQLTSGSATPPQATLAVVIIPASPPPAGDSDPANLALISLAGQLMKASRGVVVAGSLPGSGPGSAIDELVNGNTDVHLFTVDDADTEVGQISVAQALSYLLTGGHQPAAYGVYAQAVPSPAPTPSPTPSPTPTSSPKSPG
jgi:Copper transport outer membrane protein, MctB